MSEARIQQILKLSNYMASGFPYYSGVYSPVINTVTNNANIILKKSTNNWYTIRSTGANHTIDSLVVGDAILGTFSEITISPSISVVGTVSSNWSNYFQIRWWDSSNIAVFTTDYDSPHALKLYTVNISTGVSTSKGTLIASPTASYTGLKVGVNSTHIYVQTSTTAGYNSQIKKYLKTDLSATDYTCPLLYIYTGSSTISNFTYYITMAVTSSYLWFINYRYGSNDSTRLWVSSISDVEKMVCISGEIGHVFDNSSTKFYYQTDYDGLSVYLKPNSDVGAIYITESDLIKYGVV